MLIGVTAFIASAFRLRSGTALRRFVKDQHWEGDDTHTPLIHVPSPFLDELGDEYQVFAVEDNPPLVHVYEDGNLIAVVTVMHGGYLWYVFEPAGFGGIYQVSPQGEVTTMQEGIGFDEHTRGRRNTPKSRAALIAQLLLLIAEQSAEPENPDLPALPAEGYLPNGMTVKEWEKSLVHLSPEERVAKVKAMAPEVAQAYGLTKDPRLSKLNNRDVWVNPRDGYLYSLDTQHGRFEACEPKRGQHMTEVNFAMEAVPGSRDTSGGHDLRVG